MSIQGTEKKFVLTQSDIVNALKEAAAGNDQNITLIKKSLLPEQQLAFNILYYRFYIENTNDPSINAELAVNRQGIILNQLNALILRNFSQALVAISHDQRMTLYYGLTILSASTAFEVLSQQIPFIEEMVETRTLFMKQLANNDLILPIEHALGKEGLPPLSDWEKNVLIPSELSNVGGNGRAALLYDRLPIKSKPKPKLVAKLEELTHYLNPFIVAIATHASPKMRQALIYSLDKTIKSNIEFDLLYPALTEQCKLMTHDTIMQLAKILADKIGASEAKTSEETFNNVMKGLPNYLKGLVELNEAELTVISHILKNNSTLFSIDDSKREHIIQCIAAVKAKTNDLDINDKIDSVFNEMIEKFNPKSIVQ